VEMSKSSSSHIQDKLIGFIRNWEQLQRTGWKSKKNDYDCIQLLKTFRPNKVYRIGHAITLRWW
jgi:hypothetical protein